MVQFSSTLTLVSHLSLLSIPKSMPVFGTLLYWNGKKYSSLPLHILYFWWHLPFSCTEIKLIRLLCFQKFFYSGKEKKYFKGTVSLNNILSRVWNYSLVCRPSATWRSIPATWTSFQSFRPTWRFCCFSTLKMGNLYFVHICFLSLFPFLCHAGNAVLICLWQYNGKRVNDCRSHKSHQV